MQVLAVEIGEPCHPEQAEAALHLVLQKLEHAHERGLAAGGERVALHPAEPDEVGSGRHRLHDIGAARHASIDDDLCPAVDHIDDLRQHVHRAAAVVELAAAVIGDVDPQDTP